MIEVNECNRDIPSDCQSYHVDQEHHWDYCQNDATIFQERNACNEQKNLDEFTHFVEIDDSVSKLSMDFATVGYSQL